MLSLSTIKLQPKYASLCTKRFFASENSSIKQGWEAVIGIEVHAQINTKTKLFSGKTRDQCLVYTMTKNSLC
jgi:hypothetical protein